MPSASIDLAGALSALAPSQVLALAAAFTVATMLWDVWKLRRRPRMTLAEEYDLYERAMRDAKTDEERAELEGVRRSIVKRMAGWRPPRPLYAIVANCPFGVACAAWLAVTLAAADAAGLERWAGCWVVLVGLEAAKNVASIVLHALAGRRGGGRHFR